MWNRNDEINVTFDGKTYEVSKIVIHSGYADSSLLDIDLALLTTKEKITNVSFPEINQKELSLGTELIGVGFGASGPANNTSAIEQNDEKIYGTNILDSISIVNNGYNIFHTDFDSDDNCCNELGDSTQTKYEFCSVGGDSGCPYFYENESKLYLVGLLFSGYLNVDNFLKGSYYSSRNLVLELKDLTGWVEENK